MCITSNIEGELSCIVFAWLSYGIFCAFKRAKFIFLLKTKIQGWECLNTPIYPVQSFFVQVIGVENSLFLSLFLTVSI